MASSHQCFPNDRQRRAHALLDRQSDDFEAPIIAPPAAAMCEAQKVEGLWLADTTFPALLCSIPPKAYQPRLLRVQLQAKMGEALPQCLQDVLRLSFVLEPHHAVVGITDNDHVAFSISSTPLLDP